MTKKQYGYVVNTPWLRSGRKGGRAEEMVYASNKTSALKKFKKKHKIKRMPNGYRIKRHN